MGIICKNLTIFKYKIKYFRHTLCLVVYLGVIHFRKLYEKMGDLTINIKTGGKYYVL